MAHRHFFGLVFCLIYSDVYVKKSLKDEFHHYDNVNNKCNKQVYRKIYPNYENFVRGMIFFM